MELGRAASTAAQWTTAAYRDYCVFGGEEGALQAKMLWVACPWPEPPARKSFGPQNAQVPGIVGFAALRTVVATGDCELENMAVHAAWRRRRLGQRLLQAGLLWCRAWRGAGKVIEPATPVMRLEVRASNAGAIAFYRRMGFTNCGQRKSYYANPPEDAILMERELINAPTRADPYS
ncbi:MAG: GNAT family N-acetyltransferase [Acidobacteriaceae bacterium]